MARVTVRPTRLELDYGDDGLPVGELVVKNVGRQRVAFALRNADARLGVVPLDDYTMRPACGFVQPTEECVVTVVRRLACRRLAARRANLLLDAAVAVEADAKPLVVLGRRGAVVSHTNVEVGGAVKGSPPSPFGSADARAVFQLQTMLVPMPLLSVGARRFARLATSPLLARTGPRLLCVELAGERTVALRNASTWRVCYRAELKLAGPWPALVGLLRVDEDEMALWRLAVRKATTRGTLDPGATVDFTLHPLVSKYAQLADKLSLRAMTIPT